MCSVRACEKRVRRSMSCSPLSEPSISAYVVHIDTARSPKLPCLHVCRARSVAAPLLGAAHLNFHLKPAELARTEANPRSRKWRSNTINSPIHHHPHVPLLINLLTLPLLPSSPANNGRRARARPLTHSLVSPGSPLPPLQTSSCAPLSAPNPHSHLSSGYDLGS